jgi:hypothetical protein
MTTTSTTTSAVQAMPFTFRYADTEDYGVRVTAAINAQITTTGNAIERLGAMVVTAYAQNVADLMGYDSWDEYVSAELHFDGFKPDAPSRALLVAMFRQAGMDYASVANVVKASVRTVKDDAKQAGLTRTNAKPAPRGVTVAGKPSADAIAALHKAIDGLDTDTLDDLASYIAQVMRQRNKAGAPRVAA